MTLKTVKMPTLDTPRGVASELGMTFSDDLAAHFQSFGDGIVDKMTDELPAVKRPRLPSYRATGDENRYSIPFGTVERLPVGLMLIGKLFDENTIYSAAHAFEQKADWKAIKA